MILVLCVLLVATSFSFNAVKALFLLSLSLAKTLPFHLLRPSTHARLKDARSPFGFSSFYKSWLFFKTVTFEILEDSQPCLGALKRNVSDSRFRRARVYYYFLRDAIRNGWCAVVKIGAALQTGDLATNYQAHAFQGSSFPF
jgi:hypothetical protein